MIKETLQRRWGEAKYEKAGVGGRQIVIKTRGGVLSSKANWNKPAE